VAEWPDPLPPLAPARPRVWTVGLACAVLFLGMAAITGTALLVDVLRTASLPDGAGATGAEDEAFFLGFPGLIAVAALSYATVAWRLWRFRTAV